MTKSTVTVVPLGEPSRFWKWVDSMFKPEASALGFVSETCLYNIHSASNRNWWFDKSGNRWPLRNSL